MFKKIKILISLSIIQIKASDLLHFTHFYVKIVKTSNKNLFDLSNLINNTESKN